MFFLIADNVSERRRLRDKPGQEKLALRALPLKTRGWSLACAIQLSAVKWPRDVKS
jgi:hypothetical protein